MKKILLILTLVFSLAVTTVSAANYSDWAEEDIIKAQNGGIISQAQMQGDLTQPIKRSDIAMLAVKTYINVKGYDISNMDSHFTDTKSPYPKAAYRLGILYGTSDTEFSPNDNATRQEMAKIILSLQAVLNGEEVMLPSNPQTSFTDFSAMSEWAKPYVAKAAADGIINGYPDGSFGGTIAVSWEQAIALILRCTDLNEMPEIPTVEEKPVQEINISGYVGTVVHGMTRIKWNSAGVKIVTVKQERNSYYKGDIAPITETYSASGYIDIELNPNRTYTITVDGVSKTFKTAEVLPAGGSAIKESTATFKVHHAIADKVKLVFEDIYNGPEKFPIKDVGGYAWRGGRSEHNGGTAIDINANENYCIYNNGTVIGKYWKPYEDVYSIKPYGDVVNAFERHGFTWGGDSWRNPKDYMHFSYLGT